MLLIIPMLLFSNLQAITVSSSRRRWLGARSHIELERFGGLDGNRRPGTFTQTLSTRVAGESSEMSERREVRALLLTTSLRLSRYGPQHRRTPTMSLLARLHDQLEPGGANGVPLAELLTSLTADAARLASGTDVDVSLPGWRQSTATD